MCLIHLDGNSEPLTLGCIHTGNIFKKGGTWRLAGFENTLLGLKCRQYHMFEEHKSNLDVLMFGKVDCSISCCSNSLGIVNYTINIHK